MTTLQRKFIDLMGGATSSDEPGCSAGVKLSELVSEAVPSFGAKGLTDTPSVYVPSTFIAGARRIRRPCE